MIFRIFNDEALRNEPPHRDAYRSRNGWRIEIERIEELEGLAGYGGAVTVTFDPGEDPRIRLTPLETRLHEARRKVEAQAARAPFQGEAVRIGNGDHPSGL